MALVQKSFSEIITFSRASNATRFAPDGVLQYAPHNLLLQSQDFTTSWTVAGTNATVTSNTTAAPDGTTTADTLTDNATSGVHRVAQSLTTSNTNQMVYSVFAKYSTLQWISISLSTSTGTWAGAKFDVQNGVLGSTSQQGTGFTADSSSITAVGNGWYRCVLVLTPGASGSTVVVISGATDGTTFTTSQRGSEVYSGTSSSVFIWGAQLAVGPYPLDYTPTTTAVVYGPRFDYNPVTLAPLGLLIEEQRTNLLLYSEQFDNAAWVNSNATITANTIVSPDGTVSADTFTGAAGTSIKRIRQNVTTTALGPWTYSVWLKTDTAVSAMLFLSDSSVGAANHVRTTITFSTGSVSTATAAGTATGASASVTPAGNGWYRVSITGTFVTALTSLWAEVWLDGFTSTANTTSFYIWGAQLEAGAFATSYIPTVASTVTRSADGASINTLSPWYNATEGSLYVNFQAFAVAPSSATQTICTFSDGSLSNIIQLTKRANADVSTRFIVTAAGVGQVFANLGTFTTNSNKISFAYAVNNFAGVLNVNSVRTSASGAVPSGINKLEIGASVSTTSLLNGHISRIAYYNRRLTDAELQVLTS